MVHVEFQQQIYVLTVSEDADDNIRRIHTTHVCRNHTSQLSQHSLR